MNGAKQEDFQAAAVSGSTSSWMRFLTTCEVIGTWTSMNAPYTLEEARTADSREETSGRKLRICWISSSGRLSRKDLEAIFFLLCSFLFLLVHVMMGGKEKSV